MKHALATTWILTGCLTVAFVSDPSSAQHPSSHATPSPGVSAPPQTGPANAVVELENDAVVVVRIRMALHERTPMHDITGARLVVWLTDAHLRDTHPDGHTAEIRRRERRYRLGSRATTCRRESLARTLGISRHRAEKRWDRGGK